MSAGAVTGLVIVGGIILLIFLKVIFSIGKDKLP